MTPFLMPLALLLASASAVAQPDMLVPARESVAGVAQVDWTIRWWQWAFSFERARSPIADRTGELCGSRQSGPVWFLAGTYGTSRTERTCTVPPGKHLLFPLINYVTFRGEDTQESCMSMAVRADALTSQPSMLILEIDGKRYYELAPHRMATRCFSLVPGQPADAVSNGYWVAIRPLPKGKHVLNFGGVLPGMVQAVTYQLTVQ